MAKETNPLVEQRVSAARANKRWKMNLSALCREHTRDAVNTLYEIMVDAEAHTPSRVKAATELLDRGWGKAPVTVKVDQGGGLDLEALSDEALRDLIAENTASLVAMAEEGVQLDGDFEEYFEEEPDDEVRLPANRKVN